MTKRTKIIATIGPASETPAKLTALARAGMAVARLNFSHGTYENHAMLCKNVRAVSKKLKRPIALLQDLQGPKIRIAALKKPLTVRKGQRIMLGKDFFLDAPVAKFIKPKHRILIEDGLIQLVAQKCRGKLIACSVTNGGVIKSHKGVNLPDSHFNLPVLTEKDIKDLQFGLKYNPDYVALSFVSSGKDVLILRRLIKKYSRRGGVLPKIIAKIERAVAVKNIDDIIAQADAVMVARGDLGVEIADSQVPIAQKTIVTKCLAAAKPVIVATQMLNSMIENPRPTRAEVSDVANAVIDGADCVMLSGETATGKYPVEAVAEMSKIIEATEGSQYAGPSCIFSGGDHQGMKASAIAESACQLSASAGAKAIISATDTGFTARFLAHQRPSVPIIMLTDKERIYQQLALYWGVIPLCIKRHHTIIDLLKHAVQEAKKAKLVKKGDKVIVVAGNPIGQRVNMLEVRTV